MPPPAFLEVAAPGVARMPVADAPIRADAAARRMAHGASLQIGPRHRSLVLTVPGLFIGLVQPSRRDSETANLATRQVKVDLDALMDTTTGLDQGIVYLPDYVTILNSGRGAWDNARRRLTYHVDAVTAPGDLLDHALLYLRGWQSEDAAQETRYANYGDDLLRYWKAVGKSQQ